MTEDTSTRDTPGETPPLTAKYHKARRNLTITCALLLVWEYLGLKVGNEIKAPVANTVLSIKHSDAIPSLLIALMLYFAFRFQVEWKQCSPLRRDMRYARYDYLGAGLLFLAAVGLVAFQAVSGIDLAPIVSSTNKADASAYFGSAAISATARFYIGYVVDYGIRDYFENNGYWPLSTIMLLGHLEKSALAIASQISFIQ